MDERFEDLQATRFSTPPLAAEKTKPSQIPASPASRVLDDQDEIAEMKTNLTLKDSARPCSSTRNRKKRKTALDIIPVITID